MRRFFALLFLAFGLPTVAEAGMLRDWWIPADPEAITTAADVQRGAADALYQCRTASSYVNAYGELRVNWALAESCMRSGGWQEVSKAEWTLATTPAQTIARAE